jgi:hypothetical protein
MKLGIPLTGSYERISLEGNVALLGSRTMPGLLWRLEVGTELQPSENVFPLVPNQLNRIDFPPTNSAALCQLKPIVSANCGIFAVRLSPSTEMDVAK